MMNNLDTISRYRTEDFDYQKMLFKLINLKIQKEDKKYIAF